MGRFLSPLLSQSQAPRLTRLSQKAAWYIYSLRARLQLLNCHLRVNFWLAAAMAATAIA
jgi:hypothetical protein